MIKRLYTLAEKGFLDGTIWGVSYEVSPVSHEFGVWTGPGFNSCGCVCSVKELLSDKWRYHLQLCGALWLVPVLERFAAGEAITTQAILDAYEQKHGHPAPFQNIEMREPAT